MARPQKIGLDYFPFDVDFFADRKIKILFARFGTLGISFYLYLLCEIYRDKGFFLRCDDEFLEVTSAELHIDRDTILSLLDFMIQRQLIHGRLFQDFHVITSRGIQERYQRAKENAGRKTPVPVPCELWLIGERETSDFIRIRGGEILEDKIAAPQKKKTSCAADACFAYGEKKINKSGRVAETSEGDVPGKDEWVSVEKTVRKAEGLGENNDAAVADKREKKKRTGGEMFSMGEQCLPGENSGEINPQRKSKEIKHKKRGRGSAENVIVDMVRRAFPSAPPTLEQEIYDFLLDGAPETLIRYGILEALRKGKPYSYMAAIVRQRLAEGRLQDAGYGRWEPPSYDLDAFEKLGFCVPKEPKPYDEG